MKIEQLLAQHLYNSKELTLQGIGTFRLNPLVSLPSADDKDFVVPQDAIHFEYNLRTTEDDALINYIVLHTRKIKPLASADLDSYVALAKQFLNIGKPLIIEGIGTVQKNQQGEYEFIQGNFVAPKEEEAPNQFKEKKEEAVSFRSESNNNMQKKITHAPILIVILIVIGLITFYFIHKKNHPSVTADQIPLVSTQTDTVVIRDTATQTRDTARQTKDTVKQTIDSSLIKATPVVKDSFNFKIVIKTYTDSVRANAAYLRLTKYGNKLILYKSDSLYKLAMPFMTPLSDTTRAKDSLAIFFKAKTKIEL